MGTQTSKSPTKRKNQDAGAASQSTSPAPSVGASSSQSSPATASPGCSVAGGLQAPRTPSRPLNARQQQELDDEAFARRLVMEEIAGFGGSHGSQFGHSGAGAMAQQVQTARAGCPFCNAQNEFPATPGGAAVMMQCGACSQQFQVAMPAADAVGAAAAGAAAPSSGSSGRTSLQLCRRCGTMNQFPAPLPGQPMPDVLCGFCGAIAPGSQRRQRHRTNEQRLIEQMLLDGQHGRARAGAGPMVRVNVGGQRRLVPLALLLALMAEEAEKGNPAQQADIAALPTRKLDGSENLGEQMKCTICLEDFGDGDDLKTLPCLHIYHQKCIEQWLHTDNSCPVCKTPIGEAARRVRQ